MIKKEDIEIRYVDNDFNDVITKSGKTEKVHSHTDVEFVLFNTVYCALKLGYPIEEKAAIDEVLTLLNMNFVKPS